MQGESVKRTVGRPKTPNPGELCGRPKRNGTGPCQNRAGANTEHLGVGACWVHGGRSPEAQTAGKREIERQAAVAATMTYGLPVETDPLSALRDELYRTAGHVAWLQAVVGALEHDPQGRSGLKQYSTSDDGGTVERPAIWVDLYQRERKHLLDVTKTCIAVGIEERRIDAIKEQGAQIATVLRGVLGDLGVLNRPEVPDIVRKHLTAVAGTG